MRTYLGLLAVLGLALLALADDKTAAPAVAKPTKAPEPDDLGWCKEDKMAAEICIACAHLPRVLAFPPGECCTDTDALEICRMCLDDPVRCLRDEIDVMQGSGGVDEDDFGEIEEEEAEEEYPGVDKRYGMLFFGQRPIFVPTRSVVNELPVTEKRYGTLNLGFDGAEEGEEPSKRWGSLNIGKRFGTLNLGSYFGKRYGTLGVGSKYLGYLAKRYGTLSLGKRYGTLNIGKRFGTLNLGNNGYKKRFGTLNLGSYMIPGKRSELLSQEELEKRYGTLSLGKRYGTLNMSKRWGTLSLGKRYGTLGMGGQYAFYPYKRNEYVPYNGAIGTDRKKRYGRLFMGRFSGKRFGGRNDVVYSEIKK